MKIKELREILESIPEEDQGLEVHVYADHGQSPESAYFYETVYIDSESGIYDADEIESECFDTEGLRRVYLISS